MMRVLIADDERPARDELNYLLKQIEGIVVVGEAASGEEVLAQVKELNPDVLFLDIQMPDASGIDIARQLFTEKIKPVVVFVTAFDQYAVEAFAVNAIDYLLKPIHEDRLTETISRLKKRLESMPSLSESESTQEFNSSSKELNASADAAQEYRRKLDLIYNTLNPSSHKLKIEENGRIYLIPSSDILYATIEERLVRVITEQKSYLTNYSLSDLEELLGPSFLRVHKSYLANVDKIDSIVPWFNNTYNLIMKDHYEIPVSRSNVKTFRQRMGL